MSMRRLVGLALMVALVAASGCGGDDDEGTATTETTTATSGSGAERLTDEQWSSYVTASDAFVSARDEAAKRLENCPDDTAAALSACVETSLDDLEAAATTLGDTLSGFVTTVSGQCQDDTAAFQSYVTPYVNAVQTLQGAIETGNVSQIPSAKATLQTLTEGGAAEREAFEKSCAPA